MAWRSGGGNNDEMVDNLKRFGVIRSQAVEDGFRAVDRKYFVPPNRLNLAHADQPIREGKLHISAPHIYGTVLEALDLQPHSSSSFLNIGSGTGYVSCLVAHILGPTSSCFSIELEEEAVAHSQRATAAWKQDRRQDAGSHMEFYQGNGLHLDATQGEAALGFDRIYIGAAAERRDLPQIAELLRPGGILVGPVGDELIKVIRISKSQSPQPRETSVPRSFGGRAPMLSGDFQTSVLSGVRFSPLIHTSPYSAIIIRSPVWEPALHRFYPESFRKSCKTILLCCAASHIQTGSRSRRWQLHERQKVNVASLLPRALWMEVLSYTHRAWFEPQLSEESLLRIRLQQVEATLRQEQEARLELEKRLRMAEGERDIYRQIARTWQSRIERVLGETLASDILDGALVVMHDLHDSDLHGDDVDDQDDDETQGSGNGTNVDTDEEHSLEHETAEDMEEETVTEGDDHGAMDEVVDTVAITHSEAGITGRTVRVVSISENI